MRVIVKEPEPSTPVQVKDCRPGEVVVVSGCSEFYYMVVRIRSELYGVNLEEGGGYVDEDAVVLRKVPAEAHVDECNAEIV